MTSPMWCLTVGITTLIVTGLTLDVSPIPNLLVGGLAIVVLCCRAISSRLERGVSSRSLGSARSLIANLLARLTGVTDRYLTLGSNSQYQIGDF